jgi:hypothetical protein
MEVNGLHQAPAFQTGKTVVVVDVTKERKQLPFPEI